MKTTSTNSLKSCGIVMLFGLLLGTTHLVLAQDLQISDCYWTLRTDCDEDDYTSARWLVVDMTGTAPSNTAYIDVVAYYGEVDELLERTSVFDTPQSRRSMWIYGTNHFMGSIRVYLRDGVSDAIIDQYVFSNERFESPANDKEVSLAFGDWASYDFQDNDGDGYYAFHRLQVNYNLCPSSETQEVYFMVSACKHPIFAGSCPYYTTGSYTLDQPGEILSVLIGDYTGELDSGQYQIDVVAYDANTHDQLTGFSTIQSDKKFETEIQDAPPPADFSIGLVYLDDYPTDRDGDLYSRARELYFDPNVSSGTYTLTAKVLYKEADEEDYEEYYESAPFEITGSEQLFESMTLGVPTGALDSNIYDLKIELYLGTMLIAEKDHTDDNNLNDQGFETPLQDASLLIESCFWSETFDFDHDDSPSMGDLQVTLNTLDDADDISLILSGWCGEVSEEYVSGTFHLDGSMDTTVRFGFYNIACGATLFLVRESTGDIENSCTIDTDLNFESMSNDEYYQVDTCYWVDTLDYDSDGYFSSAKLVVDVDGGPHSKEVYLPLSMCLHPIMAGPCPYDTLFFKVDSADRTDSIVFQIAYPNNQLVRGGYQVAFTINDALTNDYVVSWEYPEDSMLFEPMEDDQYFEIDSIYWIDTVDNDGDGYYSSGKLIVDVDGGPFSQDVYLPLSMCLRPILAGPCPYDTAYFHIDSLDRVDSCVIEVGLPNDELIRGGYQVAFTINHTRTDEYLINWQYPEDSMLFEPIENDPVLTRNETSHRFGINIFPNPTQQHLTVQLLNTPTGVNRIQLIDLQGRVLQDHRRFDKNEVTLRVDLSGEPSGMFILQVYTLENSYRYIVCKH